MSDQERQIKRIRQACEPCRRKKSRCPGEKPICSHCERLGQASRCTYAPDRVESNRNRSTTPTADKENTSERLSVLEQYMAEMHELLRTRAHSSATRDSSRSGRGRHSEPRYDERRLSELNRASPPTLSFHPNSSLRPDPSFLPNPSLLSEAEGLFATFCDCQPLPLFAPGHLALGGRVQELQIAVILLASRFDRTRHLVKEIAPWQPLRHVRSRITQNLIDGPIELSTLQTMCLLSLIEFNDGATARASSYSSMAMDLAQSAGLATESPWASAKDLEERRRCYWSLVLLKNLYGNMAGTFSFIPNDYTPKHPTSTQPPSRSNSSITEPGLPQPDAPAGSAPVAEKDLGLLAYVISMSELWAQTVRYARRRGKSQQPPPWTPESEYQRIMVRLMELETRMPYKYRYKPARLGDYSTAELQQSRTFWAPWFLNQMLYHSLLCLLNHPLILSLQLRNFRMTMVPEVFLQHTDDLTQTHTEWVVHLLDQITSKDFGPSDPYPAYCVAIVATIFLQQSFADDDEISRKKQDNFLRCLNFIRDVGSYWSRVAQLVCFLQFPRLLTSGGL